MTNLAGDRRPRIDEIIPVTDLATIVRVANDPILDQARNHTTGVEAAAFFGFNDNVGTSWEDVHPAGGDIPWQTAAQSVEVVSTSAADNGTTPGLGLQSVEVHSLSATGADQVEIIATNGTAAVAGTLTGCRWNLMHSETCGTYGGSHQGNIILRVAGGGTELARMTGEEGAVDTAVFYGSGEAGNGYTTIPLGKVAYLKSIQIIPDVSASKTMDVIFYEREDILDTTTPFSPKRVLWQARTITSSISHKFETYLKIKSLTDIWFRARASGGSQAIEVSCEYDICDEDENGE